MRSNIFIASTFIIALALTLLPMPDWTIWLRPAWVLMVLIFWTLILPDKINIGMAWLLGLIVDLLTGTLLGEHALAYSVVIYFVSRWHLRLIMYPLLQQTGCIFIFMLCYQLVLYLIQGSIAKAPENHLYWLSSLTTMLLWPWLFMLMQDSCRRFLIVSFRH